MTYALLMTLLSMELPYQTRHKATIRTLPDSLEKERKRRRERERGVRSEEKGAVKAERRNVRAHARVNGTAVGAEGR